MPYGSDYGFNNYEFMITDDHVLRYCIPMDNHRPGLDLKFYNSICSDPNGALLRTFMTVFNMPL